MKSWLKLSLAFKVCILCSILACTVCEKLVYSIIDEVGAENITYYSLKQQGSVTLILDSLIGDVDMYVSETNAKPDYTDYDLQSVTCGQDMVTVPEGFERPVGIGIYGHVYHPLSKYKLTVISDYDGSAIDQEGHSYLFPGQGNEESNQSMLWVIFVNILKVIVEILA